MSTPPPPQGQNPFAQGQPQAPYPPQQGAMPYAPVPEQPRRKITFKLVKNIVIVLAVAGAAIGGYIASRDDANTAAVGDCMHRGSGNDSSPDLEVVECSSSNAQYIVLAKVEGSFTSLTADSKCEEKAKDFQYSYVETGKSNSFLLCLKDYTK